MSRQTIERLYAAFARLDGNEMQACYGANASFEDEVFKVQGAREIGAMWRMLCDATRSDPASQAHWKLLVSDVTDRSAHWDAHYIFTATGRTVVNRIDAEFTFDKRGLIASHRDRFGFWAWSRQALGAPGWLLGWTPWLRNKVRAQAAARLRGFLAKR